MIHRVLLAFALAGLLFAVLGCNTMRGLGEDISEMGNALSEAAGAAAR